MRPMMSPRSFMTHLALQPVFTKLDLRNSLTTELCLFSDDTEYGFHNNELPGETGWGVGKRRIPLDPTTE